MVARLAPCSRDGFAQGLLELAEIERLGQVADEAGARERAHRLPSRNH